MRVLAWLVVAVVIVGVVVGVYGSNGINEGYTRQPGVGTPTATRQPATTTPPTSDKAVPPDTAPYDPPVTVTVPQFG